MTKTISEITAEALNALFPNQSLDDIATRADAIARKGATQPSFTLNIEDFKEQFIQPVINGMRDNLIKKQRAKVRKHKIRSIRIANRGR